MTLLPPLRAALEFLIAVIHHLTPRVIDLLRTARAATRAPILIWSDAMWEDLLEGADVIHFIDNTSALYGLVKGYSAQGDSSVLIRAFHALNISRAANVWFAWIASKANIADYPSRAAFDLMTACIRTILPSWCPETHKVAFSLPPLGADCEHTASLILATYANPTRKRKGKRTRAS